MSDVGAYYKMVLQADTHAPYCFRVLIPTLARGVYGVVCRFDFGSWDRVLLSLLIVNAVFTSISAVLLMRIAAVVTGDTTVVAITPFVFLSSYAVVHLQLVGLVDAGEGFFLTALLLTLLCGRWWPAPILIAVGAIAKETVLPLGVCAVAVWWVVARIRGMPLSRSAAAAIPLSLVAGVAAVALCRLLVDAPPYERYQFFAVQNRRHVTQCRRLSVLAHAGLCVCPAVAAGGPAVAKNPACFAGGLGQHGPVGVVSRGIRGHRHEPVAASVYCHRTGPGCLVLDLPAGPDLRQKSRPPRP